MTRLLFLLLVLSLLVVPFAFLTQWAGYLGLFSWTYVSAGYQTPVVILAVREGLPLLFSILVMAFYPAFWKTRAVMPVIWLGILMVLSFVVTSLAPYAEGASLVAGIIGIRFLLLLILPSSIFVFLKTLHPHRRSRYIRMLLGLLVSVLVVHLLVSIIGSRYGCDCQGAAIFGPRAIGIANNPNTAGAIFGLSGLLMLLGIGSGLVLLWAASIFGALLTASRVAIIGTVIVGGAALFIFRPRLRAVLTVTLLPVLFVIILNLDQLSGRSEMLAATRQQFLYDERLNIFLKGVRAMKVSELAVGRGLGYDSNTAVRILTDEERASAGINVTDSLATLTIIELGFIGAILLWLIIARYFFMIVGPAQAGVILLYFVLFSLTQNLPETYPMSLLLGVVLGCAAARRVRETRQLHRMGLARRAVGA